MKVAEYAEACAHVASAFPPRKQKWTSRNGRLAGPDGTGMNMIALAENVQSEGKPQADPWFSSVNAYRPKYDQEPSMPATHSQFYWNVNIAGVN